MGILLGIATVVLLVALTSKRRDSSDTSSGERLLPSSPAKQLSPFVRQVIVQPRSGKDDLERAAEEAEKGGYPKLAGALRARISGARNLIASPWKDVTSAAWTRFTTIMADGKKPSFINPKGFYGMFQISVRRLVDLGAMKNPKNRTATTAEGSKIRIWEADWLIPKEKFLGDPSTQYKLFERSMDLHRNVIAEKYQQVIGLPIDGHPATLSGLLALAHTAGPDGMHKWLTNGDIRRKFHWVQQAYSKANGIF